MKLINNIIFPISVVFGLFIIGPEIESPKIDKPLPKINFNLLELREWIDNKEASIENLKNLQESSSIDINKYVELYNLKI